jgi:hypothetical protein
MQKTSDPNSENHLGGIVKQVFEIDADIVQLIIENNRMMKSFEKELRKDKWLTTEEAARYIKKSKDNLTRNLKEVIGYSQPDKTILYRVQDLEAYLMRHYYPPPTSAHFMHNSVTTKRKGRTH